MPVGGQITRILKRGVLHAMHDVLSAEENDHLAQLRVDNSYRVPASDLHQFNHDAHPGVTAFIGELEALPHKASLTMTEALSLLTGEGGEAQYARIYKQQGPQQGAMKFKERQKWAPPEENLNILKLFAKSKGKAAEHVQSEYELLKKAVDHTMTLVHTH